MIRTETEKEVFPLEDNKEKLTEETVIETFADKEAKRESNDDSVEDELSAFDHNAVDNDNTDEDDEFDSTPRKRKLQNTIIVSAVIVLLVLAAAIVCRLFFYQGVVDTGLFGNIKSTTWHYKPEIPEGASIDEAAIPDYYFIFKPDGKLVVEQASYEYQGTYSIQNIEAEDLAGVTNEDAKVGQPMLVIANTGLADGNFLFTRTGNFFTENELTLTGISPAISGLSIKMDPQAYIPQAVDREGEFITDEKLTGSWVYKNELGTRRFTFNEDGTYVITSDSQNIIQKQRGVYIAKNNVITTWYETPVKQEQIFKYSIKDDKLSLTVVADIYGQKIEQSIGEYTKE